MDVSPTPALIVFNNSTKEIVARYEFTGICDTSHLEGGIYKDIAVILTPCALYVYNVNPNTAPELK